MCRVSTVYYNLFSFSNTKAELQIAEAVALIDTLHNWTVLDKIILSTKTPDKKFIFGKGNLQILTGKKNTKDFLIQCIILSVEITLTF